MEIRYHDGSELSPIVIKVDPPKNSFMYIDLLCAEQLEGYRWSFGFNDYRLQIKELPSSDLGDMRAELSGLFKLKEPAESPQSKPRWRLAFWKRGRT